MFCYKLLKWKEIGQNEGKMTKVLYVLKNEEKEEECNIYGY